MYARALADAESHSSLKKDFVYHLQNEIELAKKYCKQLDEKTSHSILEPLNTVQAMLNEHPIPIEKIVTQMQSIRNDLTSALKELSHATAHQYKPAKATVEQMEEVISVLNISEEKISIEKAAEKALKNLRNAEKNPENFTRLESIKDKIKAIENLLHLSQAFNKPLLDIQNLRNHSNSTNTHFKHYQTSSKDYFTSQQIQDSKLDDNQKKAVMELLKEFKKLTDTLDPALIDIQKRLERSITIKLDEETDADVVATANQIHKIQTKIQATLTAEMERILNKSNIQSGSIVQGKNKLIQVFREVINTATLEIQEMQKLVTQLEIRIGEKSADMFASMGNPLTVKKAPLLESKLMNQTQASNKKDKDAGYAPIIGHS